MTTISGTLAASPGGGGSDDPALCETTVNVRTQYGKPVDGAAVEPRIETAPALSDGALLVTDLTPKQTDENGQVKFDLVRGQTYRIVVTYCGVAYSITRTIPDATEYTATANV